MSRSAGSIIILVFVICFATGKSNTQTLLDRWSLGVYAGANYWITDYNQYHGGGGTSVQLRYDIVRYFALGVSAGYEILKTYQSVPLDAGTYANYMRINAIPVALVGTVHFYPRKALNPYVYAGIGAFVFQRNDGVPPQGPIDKVWRISYMVPVGVGVEDFISRNASIDARLAFANFANWVDARPLSAFKGYLSVKLGLNFYLNEGAPRRIPIGRPILR
jgi:hypothetical protein